MASKAPGLTLLGASAAWRDVTALAFTAGAVDSISLSAVGRYTAHMSGTTSSLAGGLVGFQAGVVMLCVVALLAFLTGAILSGLIIAASPASEPRKVGARALTLEAILIVTATPMLLMGHGRTLAAVWVVVPLAMAMGLQNRAGVYLAGGKARTTHVTGTLTDLGYHVGRLLRRTPVARATREKDRVAVLRTAALFAGFLIGGVSGRLAYLTVSAFAPALFALTPLVLAAAMCRANPEFRPPADNA